MPNALPPRRGGGLRGLLP